MDITQELTHVFRMVFDDPSIVISPETTADDIEGWDSLSHVNLILAVENHFQIEFNHKEIRKLKSVGDLIDLVNSKCGQ